MQNLVKFVTIFLLTNDLTLAWCPDLCVCDVNTLRCNRTDNPRVIPVNVTTVYIRGLDINTLTPETFDSTSWDTVTVLDVHAEKGNIIHGGQFQSLNNLEYLGLHAETLQYPSLYLFVGLPKVHTLDLSNNFRLRVWLIGDMLRLAQQRVLPSLTNLTLSYLSSLLTTPINLDKTFMQSVSYGRNLQFLDISHTNIDTIDFNYLYLLCNSIVHIKAQGVSLANPLNFDSAPSCSSLRSLDVIDLYLLTFAQNLTPESLGFTCDKIKVINKVETLVGNGFIPTEFNIRSYHLDMTKCECHLKKIIMRRNNFKWFNLTVTLSKTMRNSITELDLSENILEYLAPESIYSSENLQVLRLSYNKLREMQVHQREDFERLLKLSKRLQEFYIAHNNLEHIPPNFFENNENLEFIDMSENKLRSLEFDIKHLKNLIYLDLSHNWISTIDGNTQLKICNINTEIGQFKDNIPSTESTIPPLHNTTSQFKVNLSDNPYKCSCTEDSYVMLQWLQSSTCVDRLHSSYICIFQGEHLNMLTSAKAAVESKCAHQHLMNILKITIPTAIVVIMLVSLTVFLVRRHQKNLQRNQDFLNELIMGHFNKTFLAFMSFCSEDTDFVMDNVYPQLRDTLSKLTKQNDTDFVCIGDREFRLGLTVHAEVIRCMEESSVAVFVVSKTFCKKPYCQMEVDEAHSQHKPIVLLMKEFVEIDEMPKGLSRIFNRYTHASWVIGDNGGHFEPDMDIISKSIIELASRVARDE